MESSQPIIFFSSEKKKYYCSEIGACTKCRNKIVHIGLIVMVWDRHYGEIRYFCRDCWNKVKNTQFWNACYQFVMICNPPADAFPIILRIPQLRSCNNISVYSAASLKSVHTIDNTVLAGRESWEGCKVGNRCFLAEDNVRDSYLNEKSFLKLLEDIRVKK